jgi:phosphatidate cytidylyltransferase
VLQTRLSTAAVALPAVLAVVIFAPAAGFTVFIALLAAWALYEVASMTHADLRRGVLLAVCGGIPLAAILLTGRGLIALPAIVILAMALLVARVGANGAEGISHGTWQVVLGALWVGVSFPYFALLRNAHDGVALTILMFLLVVASDSGAYFFGRTLGRMKLLPKVSPNKTVEGALGGLAAALIAAFILWPWLAPALAPRFAVFLALCISLLAQLGDLANSAFKRVAGVKDSGWIFPGHGGLLDRACGLVFAAVFTYYCFRYSAAG